MKMETIELSEKTLIKLAQLKCNKEAKTFEQCINNMLKNLGVKKKK